MDWLSKMNRALDYIEENLFGEIESVYFENLMNCSNFQFSRMFSLITDVTLQEYIRRRKLTLAAFELQNTNIKIIDLSMKYGYDSPTAFTRAFQNLHGLTPKDSRKKGSVLKAYPRITFYLSIKGDVYMNYKIIEKNSFKVIGIKENISTENGNNLVRIPKIWSEANSSNRMQTIIELNNIEPNGVLGICCNFSDIDKTMDYFIAVASDKDTPKNLSSFEVPASTWAVFESIGPMPNSIQEVWKKIYADWFPTSDFNHAMTPELEVYYEGDVNSQDYRCEVWIPVTKK